MQERIRGREEKKGGENIEEQDREEKVVERRCIIRR